jgi:hypothetical protein
LKVAGIRLELFDAVTCALLDTKQSVNLNPTKPKTSTEWGARLTFTASSNPLDVYITDPKYRYPGNTVRYLNGQTGDRLDIDLLSLPATTGGQKTPPVTATPTALAGWVERAPLWTQEEKRAVRNLIFNYMNVIVSRLGEYNSLPTGLHDVADNWAKALERVGIPADVLTS